MEISMHQDMHELVCAAQKYDPIVMLLDQLPLFLNYMTYENVKIMSIIELEYKHQRSSSAYYCGRILMSQGFAAAGRLITIEYDPNRNTYICVIHYGDEENRYIKHPRGLINLDNTIASGIKISISIGKALPLCGV
jgi:hypothetical protein